MGCHHYRTRLRFPDPLRSLITAHLSNSVFSYMLFDLLLHQEILGMKLCLIVKRAAFTGNGRVYLANLAGRPSF